MADFGTIMTLLTLTRATIKFVDEVRHAPEEMKKLGKEMDSLKRLLEVLKSREGNFTARDCADLKDNSSRLQPCLLHLKKRTKQSPKRRRQLWARLLWPFRKGDIDSTLETIA